jgi:predicted ABC-type ATPase
MPELYIITGSNGAGKSSIGGYFLPSYIRGNCAVFDGDKLYMDKQRELWKSGIRAIKEAKKIAISFVNDTFDNLVDEAIVNKKDFAYEGHFTNDATWEIPKKFKEVGYVIHLIFLGLTNIETSQVRVGERAKLGGHYVEPKTISANFYGNLEKLDNYFFMFDSIKIVDTSTSQFIELCVLNTGNVKHSIATEYLPIWFTENLPNITRIISQKNNLATN